MPKEQYYKCDRCDRGPCYLLRFDDLWTSYCVIGPASADWRPVSLQKVMVDVARIRFDNEEE